MAATTRARRSTKAAKPEPEVEEVEELETEDGDIEETGDEDELEDLEEDEVADTKPAAKKSAAAEVTFGIRDLIALIKKETGEDTDPRSLRTLIRKMAREDNPRVDREIKPGNRSRYDWSGPNDAEVRAIVEAFKGGELEAEKQAKLAALKEQKAAKTAAKKKAAAAEEAETEEEAPKKTPARRAAKKTTTARKAKPAPVEEVEDDEELDFDED